jgi:hypothetical protein
MNPVSVTFVFLRPGLAMSPRLASNSVSYYLSLLRVRVIGMQHHHTWTVSLPLLILGMLFNIFNFGFLILFNNSKKNTSLRILKKKVPTFLVKDCAVAIEIRNHHYRIYSIQSIRTTCLREHTSASQSVNASPSFWQPASQERTHSVWSYREKKKKKLLLRGS